jgi:methyl-accepting chemotaxis protein
MDLLAERVRSTSENAVLASSRSDTATQLALRGGDAVEQVVSTMEGIALSSKRIAEIVNVVDSIAFQTNILALNAAVEAARAGSEGKGFAVVAGEVRGLAQRSAGAAREIKELIEDSSQRVDAGVRQVGLAGDTMRDMLDAVSQVSQIVKEISMAASEQAAGIREVNTAVTQVDSATQENAAMAEETAAAAATLEAQGERLRDAVAVFKIAADAQTASQAQVRTRAVHAEPALHGGFPLLANA